MQTSSTSGLPRHNPNMRSPSLLDSSSLMPGRLRSPSVSGPLECPKCSKYSIITRSPNTFDCLNCNFHKQLPPVVSPPLKSFQQRQRSLSYSLEPSQKFANTIDSVPEADKAGPLLFAAAAVIVGILLL